MCVENRWARSAVVARPLCKRKAPGSIPGVSILLPLTHRHTKVAQRVLLFRYLLDRYVLSCVLSYGSLSCVFAGVRWYICLRLHSNTIGSTFTFHVARRVFYYVPVCFGSVTSSRTLFYSVCIWLFVCLVCKCTCDSYCVYVVVCEFCNRCPSV